MRTIEVTEPLTIFPHDLSEPTRFEVVADLGGEYAVTIVGNWRARDAANRDDGYFPAIDLHCNRLSRGIKLERLDSATFQRIHVQDSVGTGINLVACRQSAFMDLCVHRSYAAAEPAVHLDAGPVATNNCWFGAIEVSNCGSAEYLRLEGVANNSNACRKNVFGRVMIHTPWPNVVREWPELYQQIPDRQLLRFLNADDNHFQFLNCRLDQHYDSTLTRAIVFDSQSKFNQIVAGHIQPADVYARQPDWMWISNPSQTNVVNVRIGSGRIE